MVFQVLLNKNTNYNNIIYNNFVFRQKPNSNYQYHIKDKYDVNRTKPIYFLCIIVKKTITNRYDISNILYLID